MKMTYSEQLKHPNWQRLRLEVLSSADFQCQICGDTETTLHVHHKQYLKGKLAWEYARSNFEVLCEGCHSDTHGAKDALNNALAAIPSVFWPDTADLIIGWADRFDDSRSLQFNDPYSAAIGRLAAAASRVLTLNEIEEIIDRLSHWNYTETELVVTLPKHAGQVDDDWGH
jgi:hypothetical protein